MPSPLDIASKSAVDLNILTTSMPQAQLKQISVHFLGSLQAGHSFFLDSILSSLKAGQSCFSGFHL